MIKKNKTVFIFGGGFICEQLLIFFLPGGWGFLYFYFLSLKFVNHKSKIVSQNVFNL